MFNKLYDEIKKIICENYKFFIVMIVIVLLATIRLPYYVNTPGGIIDISSKIEVDGGYPVEGSFNMAYVSELKGTIPVLLIASLRSDWDIIKQEEVVLENETIRDVSFRDHLMLEEANDNALILAYQKAGKEIEVTNRQLFVTYVDPDGRTDLEVQDEILEINGIAVNEKEALAEEISKCTIGDTLTLNVINNGKEYTRKAEIYELEGVEVIGVMISEKKDVITDPKITFHFNQSESGPSGGFMMALAIYNYLIPEDITHGLTIVGTGTIDLDGNVGSIGGVEYKLKGAVKAKADLFLVPNGDNLEEAMELKEENHYDIEIIGVSTFDEALEVLENLEG